MSSCLRILFSVTGTALVIGSAVITGFVISRIEKGISELEDDILDCTNKMSHGDESIQRSNNMINPADTKLLILQTSNTKKDCSKAITQIFKDYIQGLVYMYSAANGEGPSQETFKEWESKAIESAKGDADKLNELQDLSNSLMLQWVKRHGEILNTRKEKEISVKSKKALTSKYRDIAIVLQILGLIMVLCKDVVAV